jgi:hypothetical protein
VTENPKPDFGDLLAALPDALGAEQFKTLLARAGVRILRIVSNGQASPPGEWLDQDDDEWVVVLAGRTGLQIDGETDIRSLGMDRSRWVHCLVGYPYGSRYRLAGRVRVLKCYRTAHLAWTRVATFARIVQERRHGRRDYTIFHTDDLGDVHSVCRYGAPGCRRMWRVSRPVRPSPVRVSQRRNQKRW